jgi:transposase-like protein
LVFSFVPRCQGECGSQKKISNPVAALVWACRAISRPWSQIRNGKVANRPIYVALAVTCEGRRDILGLWAGEAPSVTGGPVGEGAKYWLHVLTEIKNRGVGDVLMVVCDGLTGLPDAISTVWPQTINQTCVVHYADLRIMPRLSRDPLQGNGLRLARSA